MIDSSKERPAIFKITPPYSKQFIPKLCDQAFLSPLSRLYDPDTLGMDYLTLLAKCENVAHTLDLKVSTS